MTTHCSRIRGCTLPALAPALAPALVVALALGAALAPTAGAQQPPRTEALTVSFSDPSRPGLLEVGLMEGTVTIRGTARQDVHIEATPREGARLRRPSEAPPGMRRLTPGAGFAVEERENRMTINGALPGQPVALVIEVPTRTNLEVSTMGGDVTVEAVTGELELNSLNGRVTLSGVGGSVVAHSLNGGVQATLTSVTAGQPMAFTSLNGNVDVTLPAAVRANLELRSDHGDVFTDFDVQMTEAPPAADRARWDPRRFRVEINRVQYGTVNGGGAEFELRTFNGDVFLRKGP